MSNWLKSPVIGALTVLAAGTASADILAEFVPPERGDGFCWERTYADDHLTRHPRQKVTEMRLLLQYDVNRRQYDFNIDIATRERAGTIFGSCLADHPESAVCRAACGKGDMLLRRSGDGDDMLMEVGGTGHLQVNARCEGDEGAAPFRIDAEPDDRVFRLHPATVRTCTVQPFKPFLDYRGR